MKLTIITGASRGLGAALAEALMAPGHRLVCMARRAMPALQHRAAEKGCLVDARIVDLSDVAAAVSALETSLAGIVPDSITEICLINNAGTVEPVRPAQRLLTEEIAAAVNLNLTAPMALTSAFLRLTADWRAGKKIVNITSGAAHKPYHGWSVYCATKAALDHFSRCVALEQQDFPNGARIASLAPGMMDTDMQAVIRALAPGDFKEQSRFLALKESGQLPSPEAAARRLIDHMEARDFGAKPVVDLRDLRNT